MSLLYDESTESSVQLASALLSSLLWSRLTGANVVTQVFNRTAIVNKKHVALLREMSDNKITIIYDSVQQYDDDVCDLALESSLGRMLLASKLTPRRVMSVMICT